MFWFGSSDKDTCHTLIVARHTTVTTLFRTAANLERLLCKSGVFIGAVWHRMFRHRQHRQVPRPSNSGSELIDNRSLARSHMPGKSLHRERESYTVWIMVEGKAVLLLDGSGLSSPAGRWEWMGARSAGTLVLGCVTQALF